MSKDGGETEKRWIETGTKGKGRLVRTGWGGFWADIRWFSVERKSDRRAEKRVMGREEYRGKEEDAVCEQRA